jgi:hypothetical protein
MSGSGQHLRSDCPLSYGRGCIIEGLVTARRLLYVPTMLKMSIRRQLFFAFALVAAISSAALLLLAGAYIGNVRAQLDRHFLEDARAALDRQSERCHQLEVETLDIVSDGALDPMLVASLVNDPQLATLFEHLPALVQLAIYDERAHAMVLVLARPGAAVQPLRAADAATLLAGPQLVHVGVHPIGRTTVFDNGRYFAIANAGSNEAPRDTVIGELDLGQLFSAAGFGQEGRVLSIDKSGKPWLTPDQADRVRTSLPGLEAVGQ